MPQRAAHGGGNGSQQVAHRLAGRHRHRDCHHAYKHARCFAEFPATTVQAGHPHHHVGLARYPGEIQCQRCHEQVERRHPETRRLGHHAVIVVAGKALDQQVCGVQGMPARRCMLALHQGLWQCGHLAAPVVGIPDERRAASVAIGVCYEGQIARVAQRRGGAVVSQCVVDFTPALHDQRRAPAIHDEVVKLDREAVQVVAGPKQGEPPGWL